MKGYVVLMVFVAAVLLVLPPIFVQSPAFGQTVESLVTTSAQAVSERWSVEHADGSTTTVSPYELTLYETAATIDPDAPAEALKAQAVVCYTAFRYQQMTKREGQADIRTTALPFPEAYQESYWQAKWGDEYDRKMTLVRQAVDSVKGKTVQYDGKPIMALYHALNTGQTENASVLLDTALPYLVSVASPADTLCEQQLTTVSLSVEEAASVIKSISGESYSEDTAAWFTACEQTAAGTVTSLSVCGKQVTGREVQAAFSLPSAAFHVSVQEGTVIFTVSGNGHFVGLSQYGAISMANDGQSYEAILKRYYQGTTIK